MSQARIADNPFAVLELHPDCSRMEIERAGQRLLAMLEVGIGGADRYETPFGTRARTPEAVREAMAALRDPRRRLVAEMWARARPATGDDEDSATETAPERSAKKESTTDGECGWTEAMDAFGFGGAR